MREIDFKDRVPTYPGRIKLTRVAGTTYTMERADEPVVEGTPIDKALYDSITKSRLTGRFYEPAVSRNVVAGLTGLTTSPIPTSGWVYDADNRYIARSGIYSVEVSSDQNTSADRAADAFTSSGWMSVGGVESWIKIYHAQALKVDKIRFRVELQYPSRLTRLVIQGSTNGTTWQELGTYASVTEDTLMDYTLINTGDYNYYRLMFTSDGSNRITVSNLSYILYDISSYTSAYTLEGMPLVWDRGQRLTISTPSNVNTYAVAENTLNGVKVNTILQSNRRYELRYNGTSFDVKEV